jgi:hypothetical protein
MQRLRAQLLGLHLEWKTKPASPHERVSDGREDRQRVLLGSPSPGRALPRDR